MVFFQHDFYEIAALMVISTVAGGLFLWLRQPLIMAFIVVGILVGPAAFNIISSGEEVELLAELGIALLLFVVGLKLDPHEIQAVGPVAIITGLSQILLTAAFGYLIALMLDFNAIASFYIAICVTFSSTIIIVKLLSDKREIDALHGRIALGVLIIQDIMVILAMIALSTFSGEDQGTSFLATVGMMFVKGGLYLLFIGVATRYLLPPLLHNLAQSTELLLLFAITWAIALAALSDGLGFSKEVGAFLAGISLASTPYRPILGARLVSLRDFLLLFFFLNLGIHVDISHFSSEIFPAIIFSIFVLIAKPIFVMILMGVMNYHKYTSALTSFSLGQISEFSLIVAALGVSLGQIDDQVMGLITLIALITMGVSSYIIIYSHLLYKVLGNYLSIFERTLSHEQKQVETVPDIHSTSVDVIVFGLGRYGGSMVKQLRQQGVNVLGIDFDPEMVKYWRNEGLLTLYGDAEDPEFITSIPLNNVKWVVSTLPGQRIGLALLKSLKLHGFQGQVALTSHSKRDSEIFQQEQADLVLLPFRDAAKEAARTLRHSIPHPQT